MPYNASTVIPGEESAPSVNLRCGNLRNAFLAFSMVFWLFTLMFACEMAAHSAIPNLAENARTIIDYFGHNSYAFMAGPVIILSTLMYFAYARKTIAWQDGVLIDGKPVSIDHYQFKILFGVANLIYLQSAGRLWIVYPVTSEDNKKFKNAKIVKQETAYNQTQVALLKSKLMASGATEKQFGFFTRGFWVSFAVFILVIIIAFAGM